MKHTKTILDNGMTVLLKENHSAPVTSQWVWYRVGSRNELPGATGISHWCEHMQFKGTDRYPAGVLDKTISRVGGMWNAFTFLDYTAFFETMPAGHTALTIDLESDRMMNARYLPEEVASERTVVISELEGSETDPYTRLSTAVHRIAFEEHPYKREVIGEKEDLRRISRDKLYAYFRSYYRPNNAVFCMSGDFDSAEVLEQVKEKFGDIEPAEIPVCTAVPEGPINGVRYTEEAGPCDVTMMRNLWRCPAGNDPDIYAIHLIDSVLGGPAPLSQFGSDSIGFRTSRLYQKLVRTGMAASIIGSYTTTIDPMVYAIGSIVNPGRTPAEVTQVILDEIADITQNGITEQERAKALKQARASFAYANENITNQGYWLGYSSMFSDDEWFDRFVPELEKVTNDDIRRVAGKYLDPDHRVTGVYRSDGGEA